MGQADKTGKFIAMCTTLPFEEVHDERDENSIPELKHVAELRDAGNMQDAIDYGISLMKMYPDNDLIPFMIGYIYYQKQFPKEAMQMAISSIPKCPRKYRLYSLAGLAEFDQRHLAEALVWWSRSVVAQCTLQDFQEHDPFLHLAHAADIIGAKRQSQLLFTMADAVEPTQPRLDQPELEKMLALKGMWIVEPFTEVLEQLDSKYLHG